MADFDQALCVIFVSTNEGKTWDMVKNTDVPEWLKQPEVMANLVAGEMAQNNSGIVLPEGVRAWYRAEVLKADGETEQ